jgi:hypothetical protein
MLLNGLPAHRKHFVLTYISWIGFSNGVRFL